MDARPRSGTPAEEFEGEYVSLQGSLKILRRRLWIIALVAVVFSGAAVAFSLSRTPQYEASISVLVGQEQDAANNSGLSNDVQGLQQLALTLAEAVNSRPLAEAVIQQQGLRTTPEEFLEEDMTAEQVPDTQFIRVSYRDPDPRRAQEVANAIGDVFSRQISQVSPAASAVTATVWDPASLPKSPVSPDPVRNGVLALVLGALMGVGLAVLLENLDDSWRSPEEAAQVSGVPTFGAIPHFSLTGEGKRKKKGRS